MSGVDVVALRAAAEAVDLGGEGWWGDETDPVPSRKQIRTGNPEDIAFIEAANPTVVLALLDRLDAIREAIDLAEIVAASSEPAPIKVGIYADAILKIKHATEER